jgi:hypothetical protein
MILGEISNLRLISQMIARPELKTASEVVSRMGAIQAQDFAMSKWAIGSRLPDSAEKEIEDDLDNGEIIRTHLLRPTWHLVSADDIYWMLDLTAPQIKILMRSWNKGLELDGKIFAKCNLLLENALSGGKFLTREELMTILNKNKIATTENRSAIIMMNAELEGLVGSGPSKNKKQTYALLSEKVSEKKKYNRDESLAKLARRYFTSHCPATLKDFIWWSGLSVSDARNALEMVKSDFISEIIGTQTYWFSSSFIQIKNNNSSAYLLSAFDEFIISYKDRSASISSDNQMKAFTRNGIFRPVIVIDGQVTGIWKRSIKNDMVIIETDFFKPHDKKLKKLIEKAADKYGKFLDKKAEINIDLDLNK